MLPQQNGPLKVRSFQKLFHRSFELEQKKMIIRHNLLIGVLGALLPRVGISSILLLFLISTQFVFISRMMLGSAAKQSV